MKLNPTALFMTQKRRVNNATKRESTRDKNSDAIPNKAKVVRKIKKKIMYTLLGGMKIANPNRVRQRGARISTFLCLFIFFQLNLSSQ